MPDVIVTVRENGGNQVEVKLDIPQEVYERLQDIARTQGLSIEEVFGQALRLEQKWGEIKKSGGREGLILRRGDELEELVAV